MGRHRKLSLYASGLESGEYTGRMFCYNCWKPLCLTGDDAVALQQRSKVVWSEARLATQGTLADRGEEGELFFLGLLASRQLRGQWLCLEWCIAQKDKKVYIPKSHLHFQETRQEHV